MPNLLKSRDGKRRIFPLTPRKMAELPKDDKSNGELGFFVSQANCRRVNMIYPMFMMVLLTFVVGLFTMKHRIASVRSGAVNHKYFKLMGGQEVPEIITKTTRCFNNMFEVPLLFYVACDLYINVGVVNFTGLLFAWIFVLMRCAQAYIHLTYNQSQTTCIAGGLRKAPKRGL